MQIFTPHLLASISKLKQVNTLKAYGFYDKSVQTTVLSTVISSNKKNIGHHFHLLMINHR